MTGMSCMMAAGATSGGGGGGASPLTCSVTLTAGDGPFNVSGASGNLNSQVGSAAIGGGGSGGAPPYTTVTSIKGDASGKLSKAAIAGDPFGHETIAWSGFSVNEVEVFYLQMDVTDSLGAKASSRYPANPATVISIKRTV